VVSSSEYSLSGLGFNYGLGKKIRWAPARIANFLHRAICSCHACGNFATIAPGNPNPLGVSAKRVRTAQLALSHLRRFERFIETARALGCDEDEAVLLPVIARRKPRTGGRRGRERPARHVVLRVILYLGSWLGPPLMSMSPTGRTFRVPPSPGCDNRDVTERSRHYAKAFSNFGADWLFAVRHVGGARCFGATIGIVHRLFTTEPNLHIR
jgi:hypothetical protein